LFASYEVGHCFADSSSSSTDDAYYSYSYDDKTPTSTPTSGTSTDAAAENLVSSLVSRAMTKMTSSIKAEGASTSDAPPPYVFECYNPNSNGNSYYYYDDSASSSSLPSSRKLLSVGSPTSIPTSRPTSTPTSIPTSIPTGTPTSVPTVTFAPTSTPTKTIISHIFYCDKQEPQIITTDGESCSTYVYSYPLGSTCSAPTASPTIPPTSSDAVQVGVSQTINGCSYTDDYLVAPGLYDKTFKKAIITSLQPSIPSIDGSSIIDFLVSPSSTAAVATSIRSRKLQTPSVVISYTLQSASVSYFT